MPTIETHTTIETLPGDVIEAPVGYTIRAEDWVRDPSNFFQWIHPKNSVGRKLMIHERGWVMASHNNIHADRFR